MENGLLTRDELARMKRIIRGEEEQDYPYR